jgi:Protein of unknown function (DUF2946)
MAVRACRVNPPLALHAHNPGMDDIVKQALAKWPHVPHCYGWLGLDARGNWYLRDNQAQALGPFAGGSLESKGSMLRHAKLIEFIQRNYDSDPQGRWFFQNGPQRVYVELEATPWIWRVAADFSVTAHTGQPVRNQRCVLDEHGRVYLETDTGFGLVHTQDMEAAANAIESGLWVPMEIGASDLPRRFAYVRSPQALEAAKPLAGAAA